MKKTEVVTVVPGICREYRFLVPEQMEIRKAKKIFLRLMKEEFPEIDEETQKYSLYQARTGFVLKDDSTFERMGIKNGEKLIFG